MISSGKVMTKCVSNFHGSEHNVHCGCIRRMPHLNSIFTQLNCALTNSKYLAFPCSCTTVSARLAHDKLTFLGSNASSCLINEVLLYFSYGLHSYNHLHHAINFRSSPVLVTLGVTPFASFVASNTTRTS